MDQGQSQVFGPIYSFQTILCPLNFKYQGMIYNLLVFSSKVIIQTACLMYNLLFQVLDIYQTSLCASYKVLSHVCIFCLFLFVFFVLFFRLSPVMTAFYDVSNILCIFRGSIVNYFQKFETLHCNTELNI